MTIKEANAIYANYTAELPIIIECIASGDRLGAIRHFYKADALLGVLKCFSQSKAYENFVLIEQLGKLAAEKGLVPIEVSRFLSQTIDILGNAE